METISGGTVRYIDVNLLPCPEDSTLVGQCDGSGVLEVILYDRVIETFALVAGDVLLVADGAVVAPDTALVSRDPWRRSLRAALPPRVEAIAQWSEPLDEALDEITGLTRRGFRRGDEAIRLELRDRGDGALLAAYELDRSVHPIVESGGIVRHGERLAWIVRRSRDPDLQVGIDTLRALLDARAVTGSRARVAPCDGIVEAIDQSFVALRTRDGQLLRIRIPHRCHVVARAGHALRAGDSITSGERSHHALLHAWGEDRFAEHLIDELEVICGPGVPRVYWALAARAMLGWRRIREPGDTGLARGAVVSREQLEQHQRAARARGGMAATANPVLQGFGAMARRLRPRQDRDSPRRAVDR